METLLYKGDPSSPPLPGFKNEEATARFGPGAFPMYVPDLTPAGDDVKAQQVYCPNPVSGEPTRVGLKSEGERIDKGKKALGQLENFRVWDGTREMRYFGTLHGATNSAYNSNTGVKLASSAAWANEYGTVGGHVFDTSANDYEATHKLCRGSESTPADAKEVPASEWGQKIDNLEIGFPFCPKSPVVLLENTIAGARVLIEIAGNPVATTDASGGTTKVYLPPNSLEAGKTITARQIYRLPGRSNLIGDKASDTIPNAHTNPANFSVTNWKIFDDKSHEGKEYGFISGGSKASKGISFRLLCCEQCNGECNTCADGFDSVNGCVAGNTKKNAKVEISYQGNTVETVTLKEDSPGVYRGTWRWAKPSSFPKGGHQYKAEVVQSPCDRNWDKRWIEIHSGEPDFADASPPEDVAASVGPPWVGSGSVDSSSGGSVTVSVKPETMEIESTVRDRDGVKKSKLNVVSTTLEPGTPTVAQRLDPSVGTTKSSGDFVNTVASTANPIPPYLVAGGRLELNPYEQITIEATGENFGNGTTTSEKLIVKANHTQPRITDIYPNPVSKVRDIEIFGDFQHAPNLQTWVEFNADSGSASGTTTSFRKKSWGLDDVGIPQDFKGYEGRVSITVVTRYVGDLNPPSTTQKSASWSFKVDLDSGQNTRNCNVSGTNIQGTSYHRKVTGVNGHLWPVYEGVSYIGNPCQSASQTDITEVRRGPYTPNNCTMYVRLCAGTCPNEDSVDWSGWKLINPGSTWNVPNGYSAGRGFQVGYFCSDWYEKIPEDLEDKDVTIEFDWQL